MPDPTLFKIILPLYTGGALGKRGKANKKYWLNMNNYRNWHFRNLSKTKIDFKEAIRQQIEQLPNLSDLWGQVEFSYTLFPPSKGRRDLTNSLSVIDKYFADALVELGKLKDDDISIVCAVSCNAGNIDKANPRMEVVISRYYPR